MTPTFSIGGHTIMIVHIVRKKQSVLTESVNTVQH